MCFLIWNKKILQYKAFSDETLDSFYYLYKIWKSIYLNELLYIELTIKKLFKPVPTKLLAHACKACCVYNNKKKLFMKLFACVSDCPFIHYEVLLHIKFMIRSNSMILTVKFLRWDQRSSSSQFAWKCPMSTRNFIMPYV